MMPERLTVLLSKPRLILELALMLALLIAGWQYNRKVRELSDTKAQFATLAADLKHQITIRDGQIQILNRRPDGHVETHTVYVPSEGTVTVVYSTAPAGVVTNPNGGPAVGLGDGTMVYIKDAGFTFRPGIGVGYDGALCPYGDVKLAFYKRYSAEVGSTSHGLGVAISRHLDDILFFHPLNIELFMHYKLLRWGDGSTVMVGLRSNF